MADRSPGPFATRRSPLADTAVLEASEILSAPQPSAIALIDGVAEAPAAATPPDAAALDTGPDQWLVVSDKHTPDELVTRLAGLGGKGVVTDVSHARFRIRLQGPTACGVLQSGVSVDLRASIFPEGRSAATAFRDIPVIVHAWAEEAFDLYVSRSYALSLCEWLVDVEKQKRAAIGEGVISQSAVPRTIASADN